MNKYIYIYIAEHHKLIKLDDQLLVDSCLVPYIKFDFSLLLLSSLGCVNYIFIRSVLENIVFGRVAVLDEHKTYRFVIILLFRLSLKLHIHETRRHGETQILKVKKHGKKR